MRIRIEQLSWLLVAKWTFAGRGLEKKSISVIGPVILVDHQNIGRDRVTVS
jgi:hypothetical protein